MSLGHPQLVAEIVAEIERSGPIPFARFMELALYHPQFGYYIRPADSPADERIGWSGDFYTSADVHPILGRALANQARQLDALLGSPTPFTVVEMGGGKGLLARDFLDAILADKPSLVDRLRYLSIERSPAMRDRQREVLKTWSDLVTWLEDLDGLPSHGVEGLFLSNELPDAFPVHRIQAAGGWIEELFVDFRDGRFVECRRPPSDPALTAYFDRLRVALPDGYRTEVNLRALGWMRSVAEKMNRGLVLTIDYGHTAQDLYGPDRAKGTLLCYWSQMAGDDPYVRVGQQDMTAHVDFTSLATVGEEAGLCVTGFTNQVSFLMGLGVEGMIGELEPDSPAFRAAVHLLRPEGMGGTFKVLIQHKGMPRPELDGLTFKPFFGSALTADESQVFAS